MEYAKQAAERNRQKYLAAQNRPQKQRGQGYEDEQDFMNRRQVVYMPEQYRY